MERDPRGGTYLICLSAENYQFKRLAAMAIYHIEALDL